MHLFFDASEIPTLQVRAATTHQEIWTPIRDYVDSELGTVPPLTAPVDGNVNTYRRYGSKLIPLAFAYIIGGQPDHRDLAKTYLLTFAGWDQWGDNNLRDIGQAHMMIGSSIAYDWLYDVLTPEEQQTVRQSLSGWAQTMYVASTEPNPVSWDNWWLKSYVQNHHWICNSALGMAGLALLGEDDRAQTWIDQASDQMALVQYILNGIEDGSWHEGIPYQNYGLTMSLPFMVSLRRIQGTDMLPHAYLRNYPYWRIYNYIPNSTQFILAYGDFEWSWHNADYPQNVLRFIASEYGDRYAEWIAQEITSAEGRHPEFWLAPWYVFEFLYCDPTISPQSPIDLDKVCVFPDLEGVIWRTGWDEEDLIFGLKTGAYGGRFAFDTFTQEVYPWEPPYEITFCELNAEHDHDDTNGFYIHKAGQWLVPESVDYQAIGTALHNTLLVDGQGQHRKPYLRYWRYPEDFTGNDGLLKETVNTISFSYLAADATGRYDHIPILQNITRHVLFVRPDYFIMLDNLEADVPHQYDWVCHFGESVLVEGDWIRGEAGGGQILGVGIVSPQSFTTATGNDGQPYVWIRPASNVANVRFINVLYPTDTFTWDMKPEIVLLGDTDQASGVRVLLEGTQDHLFKHGTEESVSLDMYVFDCQVASIIKSPEGGIQRLFFAKGMCLADMDGSRVLLEGSNPALIMEASYNGSRLDVTGEYIDTLRLYSPGVEIDQVTLNGQIVSVIRQGNYVVFRRNSMWTITVLIFNASATKDAVICDVRFTANGGPYSGANLEKQFVYTHPTSVEEIVLDLTDFANMIKVSLDAPETLDGMEFDV